MYIPFLARLHGWDWFHLFASLIFLWVESLAKLVTFLLPLVVIKGCTSSIRWFFRWVLRAPEATQASKDRPPQVSPTVDWDSIRSLRKASNIHEMCAVFGFTATSHVLSTPDDYLLTIHRLTRPEQRLQRANGEIVYFHHGLLMCSDIWCTMLREEQNLPFVLYDLGYDVWLGNNRGNKYSNKHLKLKTHSNQYWDFSMDQFAMYDIPSTINYILSLTQREYCHQPLDVAPESQLTYIGFSQGSAQAFAALSINPDLNAKVKRLIAISPATTPRGLKNRLVDTLIKTSPKLMYLMFGVRILLPSAQFWQNLMYPPLFCKVIDMGNDFLFGWKSRNIDATQKLSSYKHLYSTTSVKSVVHWFQIIRSSTFQMFYDYDESYLKNLFHAVEYPLRSIRVPINLIYGSIDSLVDIEVMTEQLGNGPNLSCFRMENYEHLDNLWGVQVGAKVIPYIVRVLETHRAPLRLLPSLSDPPSPRAVLLTPDSTAPLLQNRSVTAKAVFGETLRSTLDSLEFTRNLGHHLDR